MGRSPGPIARQMDAIALVQDNRQWDQRELALLATAHHLLERVVQAARNGDPSAFRRTLDRLHSTLEELTLRDGGENQRNTRIHLALVAANQDLERGPPGQKETPCSKQGVHESAGQQSPPVSATQGRAPRGPMST